MDKQEQDPVPLENLPEENKPSDFFTLYQQQIWGFIGWFVIASLLAPISFGLITTPVTIICLIAFALSKTRKGLAGGILLAVAINFVISLIRGLSMNATCFIPFYIDMGYF